MSSYIDTADQIRFGPDGNTVIRGVDWSEITWERLAEQYGPNRADAIMAGRDPKTQADLAGWRNLGRGRDAA